MQRSNSSSTRWHLKESPPPQKNPGIKESLGQPLDGTGSAIQINNSTKKELKRSKTFPLCVCVCVCVCAAWERRRRRRRRRFNNKQTFEPERWRFFCLLFIVGWVKRRRPPTRRGRRRASMTATSRRFPSVYHCRDEPWRY